MRAVVVFPDSADAGKNVGVRHAIRFDGVRERLGHVLLPDDLANVCGRYFRAMTL